MTEARFFYGWVIVGAAFVVMGAGYGLIYSLSDYLQPISTEFHSSRASVSFIFGLAAILSLTAGAIAGPVADRYGPRPLCWAAAGAYLLGLGLASRARTTWQLDLTAGLLVGGGVGAVYVPAVATIQRWFIQQRGTASAIATSGIGAGTLAGPLAASWLTANHGWRFSSLVTGLAAASLTAIAGSLLVARPEQLGFAPDGGTVPTMARSGLSASGVGLRDAIATRQFRLLYLALITTCAIAFFGYGQIVPYAEGHGIDPLSAPLGLAAIGFGSWLGRLGLAPVTDRLGRGRSYVGAILTMGAVMVAWLILPVPPLSSLLLIGSCLGASFGVFVALSPTMVADNFGQRSLSTITGAVYTGAGIGSLLGPWMAGLVFDHEGSYSYAIAGLAVASVVGAAAALFAGAPRLRHAH